MDKSISKVHLSIIIMLGSVWGLSEAGLGIALKSCASMASGSIMTSVALFFIAASWAIIRRILGVILLVAIACSFKIFDALLLSLPLSHGAIANPIFAFITQGFGFIVFISLLQRFFRQDRNKHIATGGASAAFSAGIFPLVKFVTGNPACVYPGTTIPLAIVFAPLAILLSCISVPLGFLAAGKLSAVSATYSIKSSKTALNFIVSPSTLVFCLILVALFRLV